MSVFQIIVVVCLVALVFIGFGIHTALNMIIDRLTVFLTDYYRGRNGIDVVDE